MKKTLLLLLLTVAVYGQNPTPFTKIKITGNTTSGAATKVNVQDSNGDVNTIPKIDLVDYLEFSTASALPAPGVVGKLYLTRDDNKIYRFNGTIYVEASVGGGGGGGSWGSITGTLSSQTDLQSALNAKENTITATTSADYYRGDKTMQPLNKTTVGLANVDNTTDLNKPISTATQTALNTKQNTITLTTIGGSGAATFSSNVLNIPIYTGGGGGSVTNVTGTSPINVSNGSTTPVVSILTASSSVSGALTSTDWNTFNNKLSSITSGNVTTALGYTPYNSSNPAGFITSSSLAPFMLSSTAASTYQPIISLTTTGTSGAATFAGNVLNIPDYGAQISLQVATAGTNKNLTSGKNFQGTLAGDNATNANDSNFFGSSAGLNATTARFSNFLGVDAGYGAVNADSSNFFGFDAGQDATNADNSNFFGVGSGNAATNADNSNFFGYRTGYLASSASYSNFIGFGTGRWFTGNNLGSNNIIIGSNISLINGTSNAINLGGVIFGFNTNAVMTGDPKINATSTGRISIGSASDNGVDRLQIAGTVVSTGFKMSGGTSSQYLMADGSTTTGGGGSSWSSITGKPTTLTGYGITDAYPLSGNPSGFLSSISSGNVTTALGFTPYNSTNPSGYITSSSLSGYLPISGATATGPFTNNSSSTYFDFRGASDSSTYGTFRNSSGGVIGYIGGANGGAISSGQPNALAIVAPNGNLLLSSGSSGVYTGNNMYALAFYQTSDIRFKNVITKTYHDIGNIKAIQYTWKDKSKGTKPQVGYSAQQVQRYIPNAVDEDEKGNLSVNYIQVLVAKIEALEKRVKELENEK